MTMAIIVILRDSKSLTHLCLTPSCIISAVTIRKNLDASQNPCENFYQFSCGSYLKENVLERNKNNLELLREQIERQLRVTLNAPVRSDASKPYHQLKLVYNFCMNTTAIEMESPRTVRMLLNGLGGCPLLQNHKWNASDFHWINLVYKLKKKGLKHNFFITLEVSVDEKNVAGHILTIDQSRPTFAEMNSTLVLDNMKKIVKRFGGVVHNYSELNQILDFDAKLFDIYNRNRYSMNNSIFYHPMTVRELQYRFPTIDWMKYIVNIVDLSDITFTYNETVVVRVPEYLSHLETLLEETSKEVQANYIILSTITSLLPLLSQRLRNLQVDKAKIYEPRWIECLNIVKKGLGLPLYALYAKQFSKGEDYQQPKEIVSHILNKFGVMLNESDWFDEITKRSAIDKMNGISVHIGFPNELKNTKLVDDYYARINSSSYLQAMLSIEKFMQYKNFDRLRNSVSETTWVDHTLLSDFDTLYFLKSNSIHVSGTMLQGIFFNSSRPRYMNYATMGSLLGAQITNGFNYAGRMYDKYGNINDWWETKTEALFMEKMRCIANKNPNFATPIDIAAHVSGLNQSYLAYSEWVKKNGNEPMLVGLTYTQRQLFWISAAQLLCEKNENVKISDFYNSAEYKINEAFSNLYNFSKDFNCPLHSTMNPEIKCSIW